MSRTKRLRSYLVGMPIAPSIADAGQANFLTSTDSGGTAAGVKVWHVGRCQPGMSRGTSNALGALRPAYLPVMAKTMIASADGPLLTQASALDANVFRPSPPAESAFGMRADLVRRHRHCQRASGPLRHVGRRLPNDQKVGADELTAPRSWQSQQAGCARPGRLSGGQWRRPRVLGRAAVPHAGPGRRPVGQAGAPKCRLICISRVVTRRPAIDIWHPALCGRCCVPDPKCLGVG